MAGHTVSGRVGRVAVALALVTVLAAGTTSCAHHEQTETVGYCAILPDSVGLYVGNPVTQMGYQIGTVDRLSPSATSVRVDFSMTEDRPLPGDVKAVVRSTSILADRALELVGNYVSGSKLQPKQCVPLDRSATPKSLSEVIGSADAFVKGINPTDSLNVGDALNGFDKAAHDNGPGVNEILTTSSRLLDNPDQPISDMGAITGNLALLTGTLVRLRDPMKQILNDSVTTMPYIRDAMIGAEGITEPLPPIITMVSDLETHAGDEVQLTLDAVSDALRINSPHARAIASLLDPVPWWINTAANHFNNKEFHLSYRPPLYRIRTPDGPVVCAIMNGSTPGSCAVVAGQPYGVDVNLLQYVFMNAGR